MEKYYEKFSFFDGVDVSSISSICRKYDSGNILYYDGDCINLHFLVSGSCKAYKLNGDSEVILYHLGAGELISDVGGKALSSVEFLQDSVVLSIDLKYASILQSSLFDELIKRNTLLNRCIDVNLTFDSMQKVCDLIENDIIFFNSTKRHEVAKFLNITSETLSRILKKLQIKGVIKIEEKFVSVLDASALSDIISSR